ncbi:hypothetical protein GCM10027300_10350 [Modestobacter lapidis]
MLAVVLLGDVGGQRPELGGDQAQALGLEPGDDLTGQATGHAIGLDEDEGAFSGGCRHGGSVRHATGASIWVDTLGCVNHS